MQTQVERGGVYWGANSGWCIPRLKVSGIARFSVSPHSNPMHFLFQNARAFEPFSNDRCLVGEPQLLHTLSSV
jgi:hypothetical protein